MELLSECFILIIRTQNPHIHLEFSGDIAVISIPDGEILKGNFPKQKMKLVLAWVEIHKDELMANWSLAVTGSETFKIEGLR